MFLRRDEVTGRFVSEQSPDLRHHIFDEDTPSSAWLAGLLAADGHVEAGRKAVTLTQSGAVGRTMVEEVRRLTNPSSRVYVGHPANGQPTYAVRLPSAVMAEDLRRKYLITPRKTLTYRWPDVSPPLRAPFLRGYVDGDGCVGIYPTPQGNPMLHLSFVGTPWFVRDAMKAVPAAGRYRAIERCKALAEARYNGRHAWTAANWIFADPDLYRGAKWHTFSRYRSVLEQDPPSWYRWLRQREIAMACLAGGGTVTAAAREAGVSVGSVYSWRARERKHGDHQ